MKRPWLGGVPPAEAEFPCQGQTHRLRFEGGQLLAVDHDDPEGEALLAALGGEVAGCLEVVKAWNAHAADVRVLTLGPVSPHDRIAADAAVVEHVDGVIGMLTAQLGGRASRRASTAGTPGAISSGIAGLARSARWAPVAQHGPGAVAAAAPPPPPAPGPGGPLRDQVPGRSSITPSPPPPPERLRDQPPKRWPSTPSSPPPVEPLRDQVPGRSSITPSPPPPTPLPQLASVGGAVPGVIRLPGRPLTLSGQAGVAAQALLANAWTAGTDWQVTSELLRLLALPRPLVDRLQLAVLVARAGDLLAAAAGDSGPAVRDGPALLAAAAARVRAAADAWLAGDDVERHPEVDVQLVSAGAALEVDARAGTAALRLTAGAGWLLEVWARQLAVVDGYLVLGALEVDAGAGRAVVRALRPPVGGRMLPPRTVALVRREGADAWTLAGR